MKTFLPTVPETISYSAINDHHYCPHYYKLVNLEKKKPWNNTPDTVFGSWTHKAVQDVCLGKSEEDTLKYFTRRWRKFCGLYKKFLTEDHMAYGLSAEKIIYGVMPSLKAEFGNFQVLDIEFRLAIPSGDKWPQRFKGFIDIILRLENEKIIIADFKTSSSFFFFQKYKETAKDYQLSLYKHYYCASNNVDPKSVETYFIVLEKDRKSKNPVSVLRITSGPKKIKNAIEWMNFSLSAINRNVYVKNRMNCLKYGADHPCFFYRSKYCS